MDQQRFAKIQELFHQAADLLPEQRRAFLAGECGDDHDLVSDVLATLEEDERGTSLLDDGIAQVASRIFDADSIATSDIGPYRMLRVLGEGGMGVVYLAERTDLGTTAAIKILRDASLSPSRRRRFAAEQRTLSRLNHPSIARLFDAGTLADGTPWIVMEYIEGLPLTEYSHQHAVSISGRIRLLRAVGEAVQHAHRHMVVHRDLKPSNVLVMTDGAVKLVDFGIAKQLDDLGAPVDHTRTGLRLMTPAYAAPEQIRGDSIGLHTDVYGLGAMLYELLTGRPPFDFSNCAPGEAEAMILGQDPTKPSLVAIRSVGAKGVPSDITTVGNATWADLDVLCLTAMQKDPARRYASVDAFLRDIDHYLNREPLEARPDTIAYRARKFTSRNRRGLSAAAAAVISVVALAAMHTVGLARARDVAVAEATRAQRIQSLMLNLFTGGEDGTAPAESLRVIDVLDRGVLEAETLAAEPMVQAELFDTLGRLNQSLGRFANADALLARALERRRSLFGGDSAMTGQALVAQGLLRLEQSQFDEAEHLVREGLGMMKRHLPPTDPTVAKAMTALGQVLEERGGYAKAIEVLEEAVRLQSVGAPASIELASSLRHLGNVYFYTGDFNRAGEVFARALAMTRQIKGERHALVAEDLINIGAVHFEQGRYPEAERYYRDALPITESWYGKDHHQTASNLTMLGRTLLFQKRYDEAVELLQRAVSVQERVFGPVHPRVASAVNELGSVALQRRRYDDAEAAYTRMRDIYRAVFPGGHYLIGVAISNLASVYNARGEFTRAEPLFRDAIAIYSERQSPEHLNTGIARIKLGRALVGQRRYAEAETELLAGYGILTRQTSPAVSWLRAAREDLAKLYSATNQTDRADRLRAELAAVESKAAAR